MLTNRFKALEDAVAQLPPEAPPAVAPDVRAAIERALEQRAASLQYLKVKRV